MTTKDQERQAIEEIRKIVEGLGENSYVGFAMEGVLELAEENIREDTAYSMKRSAEIAQEQTDELKEEIKILKKRNETIHRAEIENKDAAARLSLENERLRKEIKENQIPEELMHECYCMAYDKETGAQKKMEQAADQMAEAAIKGEDTQSLAKEYQAQKSNRRRYEKIMQQLDKMEVGEFTHTTDGYLIRKVQEDGTQRERFEFVHRAAWEEHHGEIPQGKMVSFLDGDKDNCNIENLFLIDNETNLEMNRRELRFDEAELTKVGRNIAKLNISARNRKKGKR